MTSALDPRRAGDGDGHTGDPAACVAGPWGRASGLSAAVLVVVSYLVALPYLLQGPGFYLDDWRNLARLDTVGFWRAAEASRFASRPGAWAVETLDYGILRDHPGWWWWFLSGLGALAAVMLFAVGRRFVDERVALAVAMLWVLLPDHTSLRAFPNTAAMTFGLVLLLVGILIMDHDHLVHGTLVVCAGALCLEVMLAPGLAAVWAVHLLRGRGTRRDAVISTACLFVTGGLMMIHPVYNPATADHGTPAPIVSAHFGNGLTDVPAAALVLFVVAGIGTVVGMARFARGDRRPGDGPWLVVVGMAVIVLGMAAFVLKFPTGVRGMADRNFVVSSVGAAAAWVGIGLTLFGRRRAVAVVAVAFAVVLVRADVVFQHDWATSARDTVHMLRAVEARYPGGVPPHTAVGPVVPYREGVRSLHQFFLDDAARVVLGHPIRLSVAETEAEWRQSPADRRLTWDARPGA
ncbi:MAG: hypothetical protein JST64_05795 [Actinobacteria bacterium]|nr:hypothetical protein [Actinomycetota bacterium]